MTRAARPLLWPLVPGYRLALALREMQLRTGWKPRYRLGRPVVSVGNLSAGGAGKTPLVIALAKALKERSVQVDVLSRGYGRRSALPLLVDPGGTAEKFGDEPLLIAREAAVPVFVAPERYEAGLLAENAKPACGADKSKSPQWCMHLLDDGFQHRQLHRDLDILLLRRRDLDDHLLPAGYLRETLPAAQRADVIAIPADEPEVAEWIEAQGWNKTIWRLRRHMDVPRIDGPVVAFCGIARPEQFFAGMERAGLNLAARIAFPDHYRYAARDLESLAKTARDTRAVALLTTEKDQVRLGALPGSHHQSLNLRSVPFRVQVENEPQAIDWLIETLPFN